jgi:hypothetical protein
MLFDPQSHEAVVFKNNAAVLMWLFMAVWMGMLVYFTNLAVLAPGFPAFVVALLALFWVMGLGFTALALWAPLVRVEISQDGVFVRQRAPLWRRDRRFEPKDLSISSIVGDTDNEGGGVHYTCSLLLPGKESIVLVQGNARLKVTEKRAQLISALMTAERKALAHKTETVKRLWYGIVVVGVASALAGSSFAIAQGSLGSGSELQRMEFSLGDVRFSILMPNQSRLDEVSGPGCVKIWHPRSTRATVFLELCPTVGIVKSPFMKRAKLKNGATVDYRMDHNIGVGSGGTEGELNGQLELNAKAITVTCRDQGEWSNDPSWCLDYLEYLEIKEHK